MKCPVCKSEMEVRSYQGRQFWGCGRYPKCKKTLPYYVPKADIIRPVVFSKSNFIPNKYQLAIFNEVQNGTGNVVCEACAGSGKTTTLEYVGFLLPKDRDIVYAVFNTHVRDSSLSKMPAWVKVMTTHQMGLANITAYVGKRPEVSSDKVGTILKGLMGDNWREDKWLLNVCEDIIGKLKNTLTEPNNKGIDRIVEHFGIDINDSAAKIYPLVRKAIELNNKQLDVVDFDDMLYLPIKLNMPIHQYDWVLGDEVQDWNTAQIELILRSVKSDGRILAVGDRNQSIYGWRGADLEAMDKVQQAMNAKSLPLSITYRCPLSHVQMVNSLFPDINFEPADNAKIGVLASLSYDRMLGTVADGDMVLCRTNAPMVQPVFELIRMGVKAVIRGRDIGAGLIILIEKMKTTDVDELETRLLNYKHSEVSKLRAKDKEAQAQSLIDKIETILAISQNCDNTSDVIRKIEEVFSDKREGVVFSTVHRAKGLEADNVFILKPNIMPHPMAKSDWEMAQERNIRYVAYSRAKVNLTFIGDMPIESNSEEE